MAKKDGKKDKGKQSRADQVRSAVDQAFEATSGTAQPVRDRAVQVADELSQSLARFRDLVDDARPVSTAEIAAIRDELAALSKRVEALEKAPKPRATATATTRKPAAARAATPRAAAARSSTGSSSRATGTGTGAKTAAAQRTAAKRAPAKRATTPRKPAAGSS